MAGKAKAGKTPAKGAVRVHGGRKGAQREGLTPKQARFVQEYLIDLNGTQAAIRAGYSRKTAKQQGARLLTNADLARAVEEGRSAKAIESGHTQKRVLDELAALAYSDVRHFRQDEESGDLVLAAGAPDNAWRAVSSVKFRTTTVPGSKAVTREVEFKLWDKPGSLKLAGRHVATPGFFDKVEHTGKDGVPLTFTLSLDTHDRDSD